MYLAFLPTTMRVCYILYCIFLYIIFVCHIEATKRSGKRLLLDDPEVLRSQLSTLEKRVEDLMKTFRNQETAISHLQARNNERDRDYEILSKELQTVKLQLRNLKNGGGVFVRWGKTTCPQNRSEQVYSGYAGGSRYDRPGGAANFVCLPPDPKLVSIQGNTNEMYGSEFGTNAFGPQVGEDIPCVVCRSLDDSSVLMIPARDSCYPGWRHQYSGYLASGAEAHSSATEFICMDQHPETISGGQRNEGGKYMYTVEAQCGSLHCPPYTAGGELTCVVCTK